MIPRIEFYAALNLAFIVATAAEHDAAPPLVTPGKPGLDCVCFDFWPDNTLRIVGTNGRRMAVTYLRIPGLPTRGKFHMPLARVAEVLFTFAPAIGNDPVNVQMFGHEQMMLSSADAALVIDGAPTVLYPEYQMMLEDHLDGAKGGVFDMAAIDWAMNQVRPFSDGAVRIHIKAHGATTFRPRLRAGLTAISDMIVAIRSVV